MFIITQSHQKESRKCNEMYKGIGKAGAKKRSQTYYAVLEHEAKTFFLYCIKHRGMDPEKRKIYLTKHDTGNICLTHKNTGG